MAAASHSKYGVRAAAAAIAVALLLPGQVLAGGYVNCFGGGLLYTMGTTTGFQYHYVAGLGTTPNLGSGHQQKYWGYQIGNYEWDVWGAGVTSESAACPI